MEVSAEVFLEWIFSNEFPFLIDIDIFKVEGFSLRVWEGLRQGWGYEKENHKDGQGMEWVHS